MALIYNASCATCYPPSNPYWTMQTLMGDPVFYLTCLIAPVAALLPRWVCGTLTFRSSVSPESLFLAVLPHYLSLKSSKAPLQQTMTVFYVFFPDCFSKPYREAFSPLSFSWDASWPRGPPRNSGLPKRPLLRKASQENQELNRQSRGASAPPGPCPRTAARRQPGLPSSRPAPQKPAGSPAWWM